MKAIATAVVLLALPALAQTTNQIRQELRAKEASAKKDPDELFATAQWASEKGLTAEAKRIYQNVLKLKADHEGANLAVGNALVEGKWLPAKEAEALRKKLMAAEFSAKGFVEVNGVWVEKEQVADAKRGLFHHEGKRVTRDEKLALLAGKVRHPDTDQLIDPVFLEKAQAHYFPIGNENRWVDEKEADTYHSDVKRPWIVRSTYCTVVSTLPLEKLTLVKQHADRGFEHVRPLLGMADPLPGNRPVVVVGATQDEFTSVYGQTLGDETSAHGAFLARPEASVVLPFQGSVRPAVCYWHADWGPFYVRHAAAVAYVNGLCADIGADLPMWLLHGFGAYANRFENPSDAGWFGKQHMEKGGVRNLKGFLSGYSINGEMQSKEIDYNIFQAGLLVHYAAHGGDTAATDAMQAVTACFRGEKGKNIDKAVASLASVLIAKETEIAAHLQKLIAKAP